MRKSVFIIIGACVKPDNNQVLDCWMVLDGCLILNNNDIISCSRAIRGGREGQTLKSGLGIVSAEL